MEVLSLFKIVLIIFGTLILPFRIFVFWVLEGMIPLILKQILATHALAAQFACFGITIRVIETMLLHLAAQ